MRSPHPWGFQPLEIKESEGSFVPPASWVSNAWASHHSVWKTPGRDNDNCQNLPRDKGGVILRVKRTPVIHVLNNKQHFTFQTDSRRKDLQILHALSNSTSYLDELDTDITRVVCPFSVDQNLDGGEKARHWQAETIQWRWLPGLMGLLRNV